jgi:hypothetical protein
LLVEAVIFICLEQSVDGREHVLADNDRSVSGNCCMQWKHITASAMLVGSSPGKSQLNERLSPRETLSAYAGNTELPVHSDVLFRPVCVADADVTIKVPKLTKCPYATYVPY